MMLKGDHVGDAPGLIPVPPVPGMIGVLLTLAMSVVTAISVARWQHRLLAQRPLHMSYIVMVILVILTLMCVPIPFIHKL